MACHLGTIVMHRQGTRLSIFLASGVGWALRWLLGLAVVGSSVAGAYLWRERVGMVQLDEVVYRQLDLYASALENELGKHAYLPSLVELDEQVLAVFDQPTHPARREMVNRKLASLNVRASSIAIFLIDPQGTVLAASDWDRLGPGSSRQVATLPFFVQAWRAQRSQFFAASPNDGASEYYFVKPIQRERKLLGMIGVKISLDPLEATWVDLGARSESEDILVVDDNGVVVMSSVPAWKFRSLSAMLPEQARTLEAQGMYPLQSIKPLGLVIEKTMARGVKLVRVGTGQSGERPPTARTLQERNLAPLGWRLVSVSDPSEVWRNARYAAWGGGAVAAFVCLLAMYLLHRRRALRALFAARDALQQINSQLEHRVAQRTSELRQANVELLAEAQERRLAEQELVQAGKLAVLGQMSAGVSHEINQPLTALRALSKNTAILLEQGRMAEAVGNLKAISDVAERMGRITAQLKSFARKSPLQQRAVAMPLAIGNVQLLLQHRLRAEQVECQVEASAEPQVLCDGNRLEQVLLNLSANALDAMHDAPVKVLCIRAHPANGRMHVSVSDTGPPVPDDVMRRLFEPFFSTKPAGQGLGLGLVISSNIVKEFGAELRVRRGEVGLVFEFDLELMEGTGNV